MPLRNLIVILLSAGTFLVCYGKLERSRLASLLSQAITLIEEDYVREVDEQKLFESAMEGMVGSLDEYSEFITRRDYGQFQESLDQEFGGVGIVVEKEPVTGRLVIASPLVNTPAWRAGVRSGDVIMKINDEEAEEMPLENAVRIMRGQPGTPVKLTVLRKGDPGQEDELLTFEMKRAIIPVESVLGDFRNPDGSWNFYLQEDPRIGYVRVTTFGERTAQEMRDALRFDKRDVDALLIDLRDNPGGYLTEAVDLCDMFLNSGVIVTTRGRDGEIHKEYTASRGVLFPPDKPIVVLVNKFSASASEIVAACLQDHGRAKVAGVRSWGKGTVQNIFEMEGNQSALKITVATYWRPSNKNIHKHPEDKDTDDWGVRPDEGLEVSLTDKEAGMAARRRRSRDVLFGKDLMPPPPENPQPTNRKENEPPAKEEPNEDANRTNVDKADDSVENSDAWKTFDDPQLRRAIEYLQARLSTPQAA